MHVLATNQKGNVYVVHKTGSGFSLAGPGDSDLTKTEAKKAVAWAKKKKHGDIRVTNSPYPFIILDSDTRMVNKDLAEKINRIGKKMKKYVWMGEGRRTNAQQWAFWNAYVARGKRPPLVAYPGTSNHETGNAGDVSIFMHGRNNAYTNFGYLPRVRKLMHRMNLCLPVPGEKWHVEIGNNWRS